MKRCIAIVTAGWVLLSSPAVCGNISSKEYPFLHFNSSNSDLSYNYVNSHTMMQDSRGFIWIGTHNGLNRYDGSRFKAFYKEELANDSDMITALCEDREGNIWIGTQTGLVVYDPVRNIFAGFDRVSDLQTRIHGKVTRIKADDRGIVWMAVNKQGLFSYDPRNGVLRNYFVRNGKQTIASDIVTFCFDEGGRLYLSLYFSGLYAADTRTGNISPVSVGGDDMFWERDNIVEIIRSRYNTFYIASRGKGVYEYDPEGQTARPLLTPQSNGSWITSMIMDENQRLWATTSTGVMTYNTHNGEIIAITRRGIDGFDLSRGRPNSICVDSSGGIWVGTYNNGINYSGAFAGNFRQYYRTTGGKPIYGCAGFAEDDEGRVWIATMDSGLLVYRPKTGIVEPYDNRQIPDNLLGIYYLNGHLWLSSQKGIFRLDTGTGRTKIYRRGTDIGLSDNYNYVIYSTSGGELLVGTTLGLLRYDGLRDAFLPIEDFRGIYVTDMIEDRHGELWVATSAAGLFRYSLASGRFIRNYKADGTPHALPCEIVLSVIEDSKGRIWATTFESGLLRYDARTDSFRIYDYSFQGNTVSSIFNSRIVEDRSGYLWLPSNKGYIRFSPETESMRTYTVKDGLLNNEINEKSGICLSDGSIMFGSIDGFVHFDPQSFTTTAEVPDIVVTDFYVNGRIVKAGVRDSPLATGIDGTDRIVLKSHQNTFGFDVSTPGTASPAHNSMFCMLEGYDREWRRPLMNYPVTYSNIPAGRYRFLVRSIGDKGTINDSHAPIEIVVRPAPYKSAGAVALYFCFVSGALATSIYLFYRRTIGKTRKLQAEYERAKQNELFQEKVTFFAHIVHEIKTPLTLIHTPLQNILSARNWSGEVHDDLKMIDESTNYLTKLVNELLDFVRIERRGYMLDCEHIDLAERLRTLVYSFTDVARDKNVSLSFACPAGHLFVWADRRSMDKILNNLLLNAVKYSESTIEVEARSSDDQVVVSISNDGAPIPPEYRSEIFKPFVQYRSEQRNFGNGVGIGLHLARNLAQMQGGTLSLSDEQRITRFILTFPLSADGLTGEEKDPEPENPGPQERCSVLVVDDNIELQAYLRRKLQSLYSVVTVSTGSAALEVLRNQYVDMIVTDLSMPNMSGLELCRTIRADVEISHLPIVILSARSSVESKIMAMEAGATVYIEKPFDLEYLRACLKNLSEKRVLLHNAHRNGVVINNVRMYDLPKPDEEFLLKMDRFIEENIGSPELSPRLLARTLAMSESTLTRKLRSMLNTSANSYIQIRRLTIAAQLLVSNAYRINEVCYAVGFSSPSYFTKCFKNFYGCLPKEYYERSGRQCPDTVSDQ